MDIIKELLAELESETAITQNAGTGTARPVRLVTPPEKHDLETIGYAYR